MPREERWIAHESQSVGGALEFAASTDHVLYAPRLGAKRFLAAGLLVELPVLGWDLREPLYVVCNGDRVLARARAAVVQAVHDVLESEDV